MDQLIRAITPNKRVRAFFASTTDLVNEFRRIHESSATATAAMGRMLTASAILGAQMKNETDLTTVIIDGGGAIGRMVTVADAKGHVKGYCVNPRADLPDIDGHLDVGGIVGTDGYLQVIQDLGLKEPYSGHTPLVNGEIGMDFAQYYYTSEQVESVVNLGVLVNTDLTVAGAGGYVIQLMPDAEEEDIVAVEQLVYNMQSVSSMMAQGVTAREMATIMFAPLELEILSEIPLAYACDCSREKMERALISLGQAELTNILEEDGQAELVCHFCRTRHIFTKEDLEHMIREQG